MFADLNLLEWLGLDRNQIKTIEDGDFEGLYNLTYLQLSSNKITNLQPGTFRGLTSLFDLELGSNKIMSLQPGTFRGLTSLSDIGLDGNDIQTLDCNVLAELPRPLKLDIGNNPLQCNQELCWLERERHNRTILVPYSFWGELVLPSCDSGQDWTWLMRDCVTNV